MLKYINQRYLIKQFFLPYEMSLMFWIEVTVQAVSQEVRRVSATPFIKEYSTLPSTFSTSFYMSVTNNFGQQKCDCFGVLIIGKYLFFFYLVQNSLPL